ncbi:MAG: DAK2 domain-containing protein [Bacilli bacterium]|nr:DAK2 domain-containing protein [Bacilli bacterium]
MEKIYLLDGVTFKKMLISGYETLESDYKLINDLNVFPVPDGDTGTNMKITYYNGLLAIKDETALNKIAAAFAKGCLFGARGNSGVLLSQYFKGMSNYLVDKDKITAVEFAEALVDGYKLAYKCAINPVEGTILTVAREGIENIKNQVNERMDFASLLSKTYEAMLISLENTPNLLAILKESGVVDSGGRGLLSIFAGFVNFATGKETKTVIEMAFNEEDHREMDNAIVDYSAFNENSTLDYGYCTEFLLQLLNSKIDIPSFDVNKFIKDISLLGDSLVVTVDGTIVKVHIHTKTPSNVLTFAQQYGEFLKIKIENMALQHNEILKSKKCETAIISIAMGEGIIRTFKELGSTIVINGGQTMNTSTEEILSAIKEANANNVILLPNNSNILLACRQAKELCNDTNIYIAETETVQEGYYGLSLMMGSETDPEVLLDGILSGKDMVTSAFVAKANKDYKIKDKIGHAGQYIGYIKKDIIAGSDSLVKTAMDLIDNIDEIDEKEIMFIFYGEDVNVDEINTIKEMIEEKYPYLEIGIIEGKQPIYDLLIGVINA